MKNFKIFSVLLYLIIGLFLTFNALFSQETAGQLFEKALYLEEAKGELQQAIDFYQKILDQYVENREVAAKAQLHIGICYEKLGKQEAQKAYRRVIEEYADQSDLVAEAKSRLATLAQSISNGKQKDMTVRKVWEGLDVDDCGQISPDGKYLSYVDWDTGDLAVYEIATGKKRHLTNKGSWEDSDEYAESANWSPDSKQIVYSWYNEHDEYELRIINLDGGEPRILFSTDEYNWLQPCDWSKDEKHILARLWKKDTNEVIVSISVEDGTVRVVRKFEKDRRFRNVEFSPEENYIVYDAPGKVNSGNHDIFLYSMQNGEERVLVEHPAHDYKLGWGPNGKYNLFGSDRTGTPDIWAIEVVNGKTHGEPRLIKSNKGPLPPTGLGFTTDGSFYYCEVPNRTDVYVMEIDPQTGTIVAPPHEAINSFIGSNSTPYYSPDGKSLAYVSKRAPLIRPRSFRPTGNVLCIRSLDSGKDREFRPGLNNFGFPRWSPDSRSVMVVNWEDNGESIGHYTIDVQTGKATLVLMTHRPQDIWNHEWSIDGKSVFLVRSMVWDSLRIFQIIVRDIESGTETELLSGTADEVYSISRSPDGEWLAVLGLDKKKRNLRVIPTTGGKTRVIHSFEQGDNSWMFHVWSADGKYIFLPKYCQPIDNKKWDLWRIPVEGGEAQSMGLELSPFWWLSAHPDGRHIAFSNSGSSYELPAIWVMENFLPE